MIHRDNLDDLHQSFRFYSLFISERSYDEFGFAAQQSSIFQSWPTYHLSEKRQTWPSRTSKTIIARNFFRPSSYDSPDIIPMADIEPAFRPLISVCTELPTGAATVDKVWITPEGGLILGECKLIRNPQSRREVVAQAFDYARAVTGWHFYDLQSAARIALKDPNFYALELGEGTIRPRRASVHRCC